MHTYASGDYRIHHNGGFDGDIHLTKCLDYDPNTDKDKDYWVTFKTTSKQVLKWVPPYVGIGIPWKQYLKEDLVLNGTDNHGAKQQLLFPVRVLVDFVVEHYIKDRIIQWCEQEENNSELLLMLPVIQELDKSKRKNKLAKLLLEEN